MSSLAQDLREILSKPTAIVGVGNRLRNDDAVGVLIAEQLVATIAATIAGDACTVVIAEDVIENHVFPIADGACANVLVIDAVRRAGAEYGSLVLGRIEDIEGIEGSEGIATSGGYSTHKLALSTAASILRHHGKDVYLLGIVAANTDYGSAVSTEVADAAAAVIAMISSQLPAQFQAERTE